MREKRFFLTCRTIHEQEAERRSLGPSSTASTGVNDLDIAGGLSNEVGSVNYEYSSAQGETTSVRRSDDANLDTNASGGL